MITKWRSSCLDKRLRVREPPFSEASRVSTLVWGVTVQGSRNMPFWEMLSNASSQQTLSHLFLFPIQSDKKSHKLVNFLWGLKPVPPPLLPLSFCIEITLRCLAALLWYEYDRTPVSPSCCWYFLLRGGKGSGVRVRENWLNKTRLYRSETRSTKPKPKLY